MPLYYFDINDGARTTHDEEGQPFADPGAARDAAIAVLPDIARDELLDSDRRSFTVNVRDESGRHIFRATLSLVTEWLDPAGRPPN